MSATDDRLRQVANCTISATMNIAQCRMARTALGWSLDDLASNSNVARRTIARFEAGENVALATVEKLRHALVQGGATFIDSSGQVGVLVKP